MSSSARADSLARAARDGWLVARTTVLAASRDRRLLAIGLVPPVALLALFRFAIGPSIATAEGRYVDFLGPGVLVLAAVSGALLTSVAFTEDLRDGVVDRLRALPAARSAVLVGQVLGGMAGVALSCSIVAVLAVAAGWRPEGSFLEMLGAVGLLMGFAFALAWAGCSSALRTEDGSAARLLQLSFVVALCCVSCALVPADGMPDLLRTVADVNPVSTCATAVRELAAGEDGRGHGLATVSWTVAILVIAVPRTITRYGRLG